MSMLLYERGSSLLLSQSALKDLPWESHTDEFYQHLKKFAQALLFCLILAHRRLSTQPSKNIAPFVVYLKKNCFRKVFLTNFISTWNNLLKHCIFDTLLLMKQGALRKELLIVAPFVERKFGKVSLQTFTNTSNKIPNHCIFVEFFLILG